MSRKEIEELASNYCNFDCYNDAHTDKDRYAYNLLEHTELSKEAKAVLDKAKDITRKTFEFREMFNDEHPEYQINNWDCGWYQIKAMIKAYMPAELDAFNKLFKALSDKMRPMVYELGFLKS